MSPLNYFSWRNNYLLLTIFPVLIAAASLSIAIMERVARAAVQNTLAKTETPFFL